MAFPKSHEILALTVQPEINNRVSANFLTPDVLNEALIFVRTLSPDEVYRLSKTETSVIAYSLGDYKDQTNRRMYSTDIESGQRPGGTIKHLDNRIAGSRFRVQDVDNYTKSGLGLGAVALGAGLWAGLGSSVGSIIGRNAVQFGVTAITGAGTHFLNKKTLFVNQIASHIKTLADMFNATHNAFSEFKNEVYVKRAQYKPDEDYPVQFAEKVTNSNDIIPQHAAEVQQILGRFLTYRYQRVDIAGQPGMFMRVYFEGTDPLDISRTQYDYLINLKLP